MIGVEKLTEIVELVLMSGYLKNEKPLSLLVVADAESGKTEVLKKFAFSNGVCYLTDVTAHGITKEVLPKIENGLVKHIIIPDLLKPLSRRQDTVSGLITFLNALIEEGVADISTYAQGMTYRKEHLRCGLISAITRDALIDKRHQWTSIGFLSRALPFSFRYPPTKVVEIFDYILDGGYKSETMQKIKTYKNLKEVTISKDMAKKLLPHTYSFSQANKVYGFRFQRCLQVLAQANALKNDRKKVTVKDINKVVSFMDWINLDFNAL